MTDGVIEKLGFARRRAADIRRTIPAGTFMSDTPGRQQIVQEFFFHCVGVFDFVAFVANEQRALSLKEESVNLSQCAKELSAADPLKAALLALYV